MLFLGNCKLISWSINQQVPANGTKANVLQIQFNLIQIFKQKSPTSGMMSCKHNTNRFLPLYALL